MKPFLSLLMILAGLGAAAQHEEVRAGNAFYREGNYTAAEAQYTKARSNPVAQYNLANALIKQNRYDEALTVLAPLTTQTEDKALQEKAWYNTGVIYTKQKALEQSIDAYKSALRLDPSDKEARENLQKALLEQKKQSGGGGGGGNHKDNSEADKKLKELQNKELKLRQSKMQSGGGNQPTKDW